MRPTLAALGFLFLAAAASGQEIMPTPSPTPSPSPSPTPSTGGEVTPPASGATASTHDGNFPANAVDGSLTSRWSGYGNGAWLQLDLGSTHKVAHVRVAAHLGNQRRNFFDIHTSLDAVSWTAAGTGLQTSGTSLQLETFDLPTDPSARYVRYVGRGNSDPTKAGWNSVTEIEVYEIPAGPPSAPTSLRAEPGAGRVTLNWQSSGATSFRIWRRLSQCDTFAQVGTSTSTTFTDTTVTDRRHYYYYVVAVVSGDISPPSSTVAVTPQIQPPPAPVLAFSNGPVDSGRVHLSWTAVTGSATRYTVKRAVHVPQSCQPPALATLATVDAPATSYADTTVQPGVSYVYAVSASNITGEGANSNSVITSPPWSSTPPPPPTPTPCPTGTPTPRPVPPTRTPAAPTDFTVAESIGTVQLEWQTQGHPNHAKGVSVFRAISACGPYTQIARALTGGRYVDSGLENDTAYYYFLVGVNELGESLDSAMLGATPRYAPPRAPTDLIAEVAPDPARVQLFWSQAFGVDSYTVKRGAESGGPYEVLAAGIPPRPAGWSGFHEDTSVVAGEDYYYVVAAVNAAGSSPDSAQASAAVPSGFPAPTGLRAVGRAGGIDVTWNAVAGATGYRVWRTSDRCSGFLPLATVPGTSYVDPSPSNIRYAYQVSALQGASESDRSPGVASSLLTTLAGPAVSATGGTAVSLSWPAVTGADGYRLYRRLSYTGSCAPHVHELLDTLTATAFTDATVSPGTTYSYHVVSAVNGWSGAPGTAASATTAGANEFPPPTPPACPTPTPTPAAPLPGGPVGLPGNVSALAGDREVRISWTSAPGAISHNLYRARSSCGPWGFVGTRGYWEGPPAFTDVGLTNGVTYYYLVVGASSQGEGPEPAPVTVTPGARPPLHPPRMAFGVPGNGRAKIQWSPSYSATSYVVKRYTGATYAAVGTSPTDSFVDTGLVNGTPYAYQVVAANAAGEGAGSAHGGTVTPRDAYVEVTPPASGVTGSTHDGNVPGNVVDNNFATRWSGNGSGAWMQLDLGASRYVAYVKAAAYRGHERKNRFDLRLSADGVTYNTYTGYSTSGTTTLEETFDVPDQWARYVQYVGRGATFNAGGTSSWNSVTEVSVFAEPMAIATPTPTLTPPPPGCREWVPPVSYVPQSSVWDPVTDPKNLFDNNLATRWSSNGDGAWFRVDLGTQRNVCSFSMAVYRGDMRKQRFSLQLSNDGTSWLTVLDAQSSGTTLQQEMYEFPDMFARYVRWLGHGYIANDGTPGTWNSLTEVDVFVN